MNRILSTSCLEVRNAAREFAQAELTTWFHELESPICLDIVESIRDCRAVYTRRQKQRKEKQQREIRLAMRRSSVRTWKDKNSLSLWAGASEISADAPFGIIIPFHPAPVIDLDVLPSIWNEPVECFFRNDRFFSTADILTFYRQQVDPTTTPFELPSGADISSDRPVSEPGTFSASTHLRLYPLLSQSRDSHLAKVKLYRLPIPDT